ncbi:phage tail assembly protein [Persephonella sp.]
MSLQIEYPFELPKGYIDQDGNIHKKGIMRLATAKDEILPLKDPRVQNNPAYLSVIVLSRVIVELGDLEEVTTAVIEDLFIEDLNYLQELYRRINNGEELTLKSKCQSCGQEVMVSIVPPDF